MAVDTPTPPVATDPAATAATADRAWPPAVRVSLRSGVRIATPQGLLDRACLRELDLLADGPDEPLVIDLSECTLTAVGVLDDLDPVRWHRTSATVLVACHRATGRRLLERRGVADRLHVVGRVDDALRRLLGDRLSSASAPGTPTPDGRRPGGSAVITLVGPLAVVTDGPTGREPDAPGPRPGR